MCKVLGGPLPNLVTLIFLTVLINFLSHLLFPYRFSKYSGNNRPFYEIEKNLSKLLKKTVLELQGRDD